jgi:hypothetical protein
MARGEKSEVMLVKENVKKETTFLVVKSNDTRK